MLPSLETEVSIGPSSGSARRKTIWLTTSGPDGQPQSSPVGYVWDGTSFLILSSPTAPKVRNLRHNPKAALHLDMDEAAKEGVLTLEGVARLGPAAPGEPAPLPEAEAAFFYVERYRSDMADAGLTPAEALLELSTVIRVKPTRSRAY